MCTMTQLLWQHDLLSVARFTHACVAIGNMSFFAAGSSNDSQTFDQPDVARRCTLILIMSKCRMQM